jgi:hypothetical protein
MLVLTVRIALNNTDRYPLVRSLSSVISLKGDLNGDGKVSLADLVILSEAYRSKPGDINWNANADLDGNGVVGLTDLVILTQNYGRATDVPIHIHLTWQSSNMSSTITVTWQTTSSSSGNIVKYGINSGSYSYNQIGITPHTYAGASGYIHDAELTGLTQNTVYYFVCGGDSSGWSPEKKFKTAPAHPTSVRFVMGGDSRTYVTERDKVSMVMRSDNPSFVLFCGDAVEVGTKQSLWDGFFTSMQSIWVDSNGFTIPIVPTIGNHEGNAVNYWDEFALPPPEKWYSLDWGDLLHIVVLDTETTLTGSQLTWLQHDLATHQSYMWKIALIHEPPYSSGTEHGSNLNVRAAWCPLFDQYHVQIVAAGHDHDYERSKPVYDQTVAGSYGKGTLYVVSGGWGAPVYAVNANWWTAYSRSLYNYVVVDADSSRTLSFVAKNDVRTIFEQIQIVT